MLQLDETKTFAQSLLFPIFENKHLNVVQYWKINGSSTSPMVKCTRTMFFSQIHFLYNQHVQLARTKNLLLKAFIPLLQKQCILFNIENLIIIHLSHGEMYEHTTVFKKNKAIRFSKNGVKLWAKVFVCITLRSLFMFFPNGVKVWAK